MNGYMAYAYLAIAIVAEVLGTSFLKGSNGFTRLTPSLLTALFYGVSFYCLSLALRTLSTGIAYAIWAGVGIVLISAIGWIWFKQSLDLPAILGLCLIIAGIVVINVFSHSLKA